MSDSLPKAVFLSYASQDAEAAKKICEALRAAGVEVWFDQSELRGGDSWDAKIRKQIRECALFVPVISANTNARPEGYFRLEWKLAVDRSHLVADDHPFLFPVAIGDVADATARVPDKFREVQWTHLRLDETPAELAARVMKLLGGARVEAGSSRPTRRGATPSHTSRWVRNLGMIMGLTIGLAYALVPLWRPARRSEGKPAVVPPAAPAAPAASSAPRQQAERALAMSVNQYSSTAADYAVAEGLIQKAIEMDPNDAEIWAISSLIFTSIRTRGFDHAPARRQQARMAAERAIKLAPDSVNGLFALGRTQRDSDPAAAEATFRRILALAPRHAEAMAQLAWVYDREDRPDEAAALYDRVLVLDPKNAPLTQYVRYLLYFHYGRFAEADAAIRQSVALAPSANSVTGEAMVALTWRGDAEAAARALAAAPAALQSEPRLIWVGALVQLARRDPAETLRTLQRTEAEYIQDNWFAGPKDMFAGLAHRQAGRSEAARVAWESALALVDTRLKAAPDNEDMHLARGQLLAWLGHADEARREARTLAELGSGDFNRVWVGSPVLIHAALGDADAAVPLLERFLAWDRSKNSGWPLTPALLRTDVRWDPLRTDPRFRKLAAGSGPEPGLTDGQRK